MSEIVDINVSDHMSVIDFNNVVPGLDGQAERSRFVLVSNISMLISQHRHAYSMKQTDWL